MVEHLVHSVPTSADVEKRLITGEAEKASQDFRSIGCVVSEWSFGCDIGKRNKR